jgi:hypothetical protein
MSREPNSTRLDGRGLPCARVVEDLKFTSRWLSDGKATAESRQQWQLFSHLTIYLDGEDALALDMSQLPFANESSKL